MNAFPLTRLNRQGRRDLPGAARRVCRRDPVAQSAAAANLAVACLDLSGGAVGKYVCYALLALSIDLIWGYCGILSLGHGAFFALGGYAMGMYLMRQIGTRGVYADPILPDFMVFLNWPELPLLVRLQIISPTRR